MKNLQNRHAKILTLHCIAVSITPFSMSLVTFSSDSSEIEAEKCDLKQSHGNKHFMFLSLPVRVRRSIQYWMKTSSNLLLSI